MQDEQKRKCCQFLLIMVSGAKGIRVASQAKLETDTSRCLAAPITARDCSDTHPSSIYVSVNTTQYTMAPRADGFL